MNEKVLVWAKGLASAAISSVSGSAALVIVDPMTFNLNEGLPKLGQVAATIAILAVANYLTKSPLPQ